MKALIVFLFPVLLLAEHFPSRDGSLEINLEDITYTGERTFSLKEFFQQKKIQPGCFLQWNVKPLSLVGSVFSAEEEDAGYCKNKLHVIRGIYARDLKTGMRSKLTDFFDEKDILHALESERNIVALKIPRQKNLRSLLQKLKQAQTPCDFHFEDDFLERFAFYNLEDDTIHIRMGLSHRCDEVRGNMHNLRIKLPAGKLKEALENARDRKEGFLMFDFPYTSTAFEIP